MKHFLSMRDLSEHEIMRMLQLAETIDETKVSPLNKQLFAANLFFEPSTRTKMSFTVAQRKLGIETLDFAADTSSVQKGESVYDTAKTFEAIGASLLVLRHPEDNICKGLAEQLTIPIINAGDGQGEHPTQSMLDLLTIYQEYKSFSGKKIAIVGDIKHSRVARSNAYALQTLGSEVYLCSNQDWQDDSLLFPSITIDDAVETCDVVMLLRIQHERHSDHDLKYQILEKESYLETYGMTKGRERRMKKHAIILHPAPVNRGVEIDECLVECARSRIFKQMSNGVIVRIAIMTKLLEDRGIINGYHFEKRQAVNSR